MVKQRNDEGGRFHDIVRAAKSNRDWLVPVVILVVVAAIVFS